MKRLPALQARLLRTLGDFIAPGATFREEDEEEGEEAGSVKYQCCIHPWMRLEARVLDK